MFNEDRERKRRDDLARVKQAQRKVSLFYKVPRARTHARAQRPRTLPPARARERADLDLDLDLALDLVAVLVLAEPDLDRTAWELVIFFMPERIGTQSQLATPQRQNSVTISVT